MRVRIKDKGWFEKNCDKCSGDYFPPNYIDNGYNFSTEMTYLFGKIIDLDEEGQYNGYYISQWMCDVVEEEKQEEIQKPKRKVISMIPFEVTRCTDELNISRSDYAYAVLCDDGSMWERWGNSWTRLSDIPQD